MMAQGEEAMAPVLLCETYTAMVWPYKHTSVPINKSTSDVWRAGGGDFLLLLGVERLGFRNPC